MKNIFFILIMLAILKTSLLSQTTYRLKYNNIDISFDNQGAFGIRAGGYSGGYFDDEMFLFSSGFALSGYKDSLMFSNGVMSLGIIQDYLPGTIGSDPFDSKNIIYELSRIPAFNSSWQYWKYAVELGAPFIDGDGDGIYNPVDKNNNNRVDPNEDKPLIEGDISLWTIYNDGVPQSGRQFNTIPPIGIEIQQTVFALDAPSLANTIFVRYRIVYKGLSGTDPSSLDSVLFSIWSDIDIGYSYNDFGGTDSLLNGTYLYDDSSDYYYGINPPSVFNLLLQTPPVYVKDKTFIDNNLNNVFDVNDDTPLDSCYNRIGELGLIKYLGAADQGINFASFNHKSDPTYGDPSSATRLRYRQLGLSLGGNILDPCNNSISIILNEDCSKINPLLYFSGDPVMKTGWLHTARTEIRSQTTTSLFQLIKDEPVDIIIAYVVGRGTDALNSITVAKGLSKAAIEYYESNFTQIPVGILDEPKQVVREFKLNQNYPNPFNPSTTLSFVIGNSSFVNLSVYDILGNKVSELVNEERTAGEYSFQFDGSNLSSGVYFVKLNAGRFTDSGKLILMK